ncbi:MAG: hypothetical protein J0L92_01140 [Deltaproteobacteria bacterium]|nr:hypothetical protein [Deltaproteobacteria bacterium]
MPERRDAPAPSTSTISVAKARELLARQLERGEVLAQQLLYEDVDEWIQTTRSVICAVFGDPSDATSRFDAARAGFAMFNPTQRQRELAQQNRHRFRLTVVKSCLDQLEMGLVGESPAVPDANVARQLDEVVHRLGFLDDEALHRIVVRDLAELAGATASGLHKSALLLCGSVLEAVLVDVLDRNRAVATTYMGRKKFPDDASLPKLIEIAGDASLLPDGRHLLSETAIGLARTITDHRDLIHPNAETRARIRIDAQTTQAMITLLGLVVRDLSEADGRGDIKAYADK